MIHKQDICHDLLLDHDQCTHYNFLNFTSLREPHSKPQLKDQQKGIVKNPTKFSLKKDKSHVE